MGGFYIFIMVLKSHIIAQHIAWNKQLSNWCTFLFHSTLPFRFLTSFCWFLLGFHGFSSSTLSSGEVADFRLLVRLEQGVLCLELGITLLQDHLAHLEQVAVAWVVGGEQGLGHLVLLLVLLFNQVQCSLELVLATWHLLLVQLHGTELVRQRSLKRLVGNQPKQW